MSYPRLALLACAAACSGKSAIKPAAGPGAGGAPPAVDAAAPPAVEAGIVLPDVPAADLPAAMVDLDCAAAASQRGHAGCRFQAVPIAQSAVLGSCFAMFVVNPGSQPATIRLAHRGKVVALERSARLPRGSGQALELVKLEGDRIPPRDVAVVFLAQSDAQAFARCPSVVMPAVSGQTALKVGVADDPPAGIGAAFRLESDRPVIAYQVFPYGGGSSAVTSATLLWPEEAWGKSYLAVHPVQNQNPEAVGRNVAIVAAADDTTVTMRPTADVGGAGGVPAIARGALGSFKLMAGQYVELAHPRLELTGSVIAADKPIGVFGGAPCMQVPATPCCCDSAHQQIPPIEAWGSEYAAVRFKSRAPGREEVVPWRLVGAVDGTRLSYAPAAPAGAPAMLMKGQYVELSTGEPFVVKSQDALHPFYLAGYMTGGADFEGAGDPEFVNVTPVAQFLSSYVFFTDPTYPETNLVVVRRRGTDGQFSDVRLGCSGALAGWKPLGELEYTRADLSTGAWKPLGGCNNGRQEMSSAAPFGVTVWGWGTSATGAGDPAGGYPFQALPPWYTRFASYAYPAGASLGKVNEVVVVP